MKLVQDILTEGVETAIAAVLGQEHSCSAQVKPCADSRFGDYQANGVMQAAKKLGKNPRAIAEEIIGHLKLEGVCKPPTVAGGGFINFQLHPKYVARQLTEAAADDRLGITSAKNPKTIVIDFSSPNVAKPMHVGHIRSTIIGDCLARVQRFLGNKVITDNHLGDWGTQFGMLILGWKKFRNDEDLNQEPIVELERLYKHVYDLCQTDEEIRNEARSELAILQQGDEENQAIWQTIITYSRQEFSNVYERLGVKFDHILGESFYNPMLPDVVKDLTSHGIARESEGALCIFFEQEPSLKKAAPLIIRKADGAYLYGTTDMATLRYRIRVWAPNEILYVTDARQQLHFQQVFKAAQYWWDSGTLKSKENNAEDSTLPELKHVYFGSILGEDGKPLKTREGKPVKLTSLLDEAEERALAIVVTKNSDLPEGIQKQIAKTVGIGAVKYADLSQNRLTDYVFSWSKMLAMTGNTAPYLQYAYVRVKSIFRKAVDETDIESLRTIQPELNEAEELDLAKYLLRFGEILQLVADDDKPNWLTAYLYDLAGKFSVFYDKCPVLQSTGNIRSTRLLLCHLTAETICCGLNLLGIDVIEQM